MSNRIPLSFPQFAQSLGQHHRITMAVSLVWHKQYVKATDETKDALRESFIKHFLIGFYMDGKKASQDGKKSSPEARATKVMGQTRTERTKADQNAYRAAEMKFKYHVSRDSKKPSTKAKADPVAQLLADYKKLSAGEKRSFKAQLAAL